MAPLCGSAERPTRVRLGSSPCIFATYPIMMEVELELGLSIGGSFRRSETTKPVEKAFESRRNGTGFDLDLRDDDVASVRSAESDAVESKTARETPALRRREARKKQREKRCRSATESVVSHASESDGQQQRPAKREKTESLVPVQYPYAQVQFVPYTRGIVSMIPYWTPSFPTTTQKSAFRAVPCGKLRPFLTHPSYGLTVSQKNGESLTKTTSENCSPMCSTSTASDLQSRSSSLEVDGSSDTRTQNSSQSSREQNYQKAKLQSDAQSACKNNNKKKNKKPPRPEDRASVFPEMPYVAARGDGPAGRTVTGLLYRYSGDSEITIVCVCHGTTFSPAEFVKHAGGTDVSHPLRHITVISNPPL